MNVCADGGHLLAHSFRANIKDHVLLMHNASALESMVMCTFDERVSKHTMDKINE